MKILVTGGAGFIGSHLVDKLISDGHKVAVIDDLSGGDLDNVSEEAYFSVVDCRNAKSIDRIFKDFKPEIVYHLAANAAENKAQFSPIDITSRNYSAFVNVLTPFIKYGGKRFIFTSSIAVYGALQIPFKETDKPEPEDLYGITKLAAEQTLKVMSDVHGFEYVIVRPHNVYGPRQNMTDPYRNVMTIWMNAILRNEPYYVYGDGEQRRCFSYVDDVVNALYQCGFRDVSGKTFNIGSDISWSLNEAISVLQTATDAGANMGYPIHLPDRPQEVRVAISDHTQAKQLLEYKDTHDLGDGLTKLWEWAKAKGKQQPVYTKLEIDSPKVPVNWRRHV